MTVSHNYAFAHIVLKKQFFRNPVMNYISFESQGNDILRQLWDYVGTIGEGEKVVLPSNELNCQSYPIDGDFLALIISLPKEKIRADAHFVGLVVPKPKNVNWWSEVLKNNEARYFTLEYTGKNDWNFFCEWDKGIHQNYGLGPEVDAQAFGAKIEKILLGS